MKKKIKIGLLVSVSIVLLSMLVFLGIYSYYKSTSKFEREKLDNVSINVEVFDNEENIVKEENLVNMKAIRLNILPPYVAQCFIQTEDKNFQEHNGLDYKRMLKALIINLKSMKFKQGASTISQQLVKNTHLSNEKTLKRKIKEIAITKQMENVLTKDEILECYLNCIYFGNNCYGIESASNYYFSKQAKDLTINECAVLAGMISAPNRYSPTNDIKRCKLKRDIVLQNLCDSGYITVNKLQDEKAKEINLLVTKSDQSKINSYSQASIDEACEILGISVKKLAFSGYKIHTYLNQEEQSNTKKILKDNKNSIKSDICAIRINPHSGGITSYFGTSNLKLSNIKRAPGSAIKPIIVYAPALEDGKIYPCSIINDEKLNINGYSPQNINKKYSGNISARVALQQSVNTVAVKVLSYVGIDNAKYYAEKSGIEFDIDDNNYALALGGFKHGTTLKQLTNSYLPFANNGKYIKASFVKYITDKNGKIIYKNSEKNTKVYRDDTAFLMTDMLKGCVNFGTSKKLGSLGYEVAAKTGTVGSSEGNTDAYSISYTSGDILGVWVGNLDGTKTSDLSGGKLPSSIAKEIYKTNQYTPQNFLRPNSIEELDIDMLSLKENCVVQKANSFTPSRYKLKEIFSKFNLPKQISEKFINIDDPKLISKEIDGKKIVEFEAKDYMEYELFKEINGNSEIVMSCSNVSGIQDYEVDINQSAVQNYYVVAKIKNYADNVEVISNKSNIIKFCFDKSETIHKSTDKWYV